MILRNEAPRPTARIRMVRDRFFAASCLALFVMGMVVFTGCSEGGDAPTRVELPVSDAYSMFQAEAPPIFLDVRSKGEYDRGHIEGSVHIPHTEVAGRIDELRALDQTEVIVFCERGGRARVAEGALDDAGGFEVKHLQGDMRAWRRMDLPVVTTRD
jgi:phage shock protein E